MEKRRCIRIKVDNLVADLSDEVGFFSGNISDISRNGMFLQDIPKKFNSQAKRIIIVVSANTKNFRIFAIPKWVNENRHSKSVGFEILNEPAGWIEYVKNYEPKTAKDDDVWSSVAPTHWFGFKENLAKMVQNLKNRDIQPFILMNNHLEGSAPRTISRIMGAVERS